MLITRLNPDTLHKNPAFSQAVIIEPGARLVFVGGQNAVNVDGQVVGQDVGAQTTQAMQNLVAALAAAGATLRDVFKMNIYLVQGQPLPEAYAAAQPFFDPGAPPPTVSMFVVAGLANPGYLIEIDAVAALSPDRTR